MLGHPQLLFLEELQPVVKTVTDNKRIIKNLCNFFIVSTSKLNYFHSSILQYRKYILNPDSNFNNPKAKPKVLVAPLAWGLGHATRCIPVINELLNNSCEVLIAAEGATYFLLKKEFPQVNFLHLSGYRIKYSRKKYFLLFKIFTQIPKIILSIYNEHKWLKSVILKHGIDAVISDNRFGMYNSNIPSIYITHQLLIKTGNAFTEIVAQKIHQRFIGKYNKCWVPDFEKNGLAGDLSHPKTVPHNLEYIGCLSRFELKEVEKKYDLLITLSGPEPQRTIFENKLLQEVNSFSGKALFIRGLPEKNDQVKKINEAVEMKNHLSAGEMNKAILQSEVIIGRCGYTTVMDLVKLRKKALLIPTPGQSEQEYLAKFLMEHKIFYTIAQKDFSLQKNLYEMAAFPFNIPEPDMQLYKKVINEFVHSL